MPLYHFFMDAARTPPRLGVSRSNPPVTGGTVVDTFEHDDAPWDELRKIAEARSSPLHVEWRDGVRWQKQGEEFTATPMGLESARFVANALARAMGSSRIVTQRGKIVWESVSGRAR